MSSVGDIVKAIRERLEDAGYTVLKNASPDPKNDPLPAVVVVMGGDGDQIASRRPAPINHVDLIIEYWAHLDDDYLIELLDERDDLIDAVIPDERAASDGRDDLDGTADKVERTQVMAISHPQQQNIGLLQLQIRVTYTEI